VPLPPAAVNALNAIQTTNYCFWSGTSTKKSCVGDYQRAFKKLYELAGVKNGHAHRWRDTFATELLLSGMPLEQVAVFLGHQSVLVTEKHYSPWVRARQEQLEAGVRRTFETDKMAYT
jgi:integrase/recombinase XerD